MRLLVAVLLALVLAASPASAEPVVDEPTPTADPVLSNVTPPELRGTARYAKTLTVTNGTWSEPGATFTYRWFRDDEPIDGQVASTYTTRVGDVGHRVHAEVRGDAPGLVGSSAVSPSVVVKHVTDVRRTVTYSVRTKGRITTSLATFKEQAQQTFDDPRGWRANGIAFKRVSKGGSFTLVLSQASKVPSYSSGCSAQWSCRVGRNVIINQERWKHASTAWSKKKGSVRDYRHMVVNHETGHWLGKGHAGCGKKGAKAPVMMQQSKGLKGCTINPWPKTNELYAPRFKF